MGFRAIGVAGSPIGRGFRIIGGGAAAATVIHLVSAVPSTTFDGTAPFSKARDGLLTTWWTSLNPPGPAGDTATLYLDLTADNPTKLRRSAFTARDSGLGNDFTPGPIRRLYSDTGFGALTDPGTGYVNPTGYPFANVADNQVVVTDFADQGAHLYWRLMMQLNARGIAWASASGFASIVEAAFYDTIGGAAI